MKTRTLVTCLYKHVIIGMNFKYLTEIKNLTVLPLSRVVLWHTACHRKQGLYRHWIWTKYCKKHCFIFSDRLFEEIAENCMPGRSFETISMPV